MVHDWNNFLLSGRVLKAGGTLSLIELNGSPLMDHLQQARYKSAFYFWAVTVSTCTPPPASPPPRQWLP